VRQLILTECEIAPELLAIAENLVHRLPPGTALSAEDVLEEIGSGARYFYEGLWNGCSTSERVVLRQLAEEGLVNPNNQAAVSRMLNAGLVQHGQTFRMMNESFRRRTVRRPARRRLLVERRCPHSGNDRHDRRHCRVQAGWPVVAHTGTTRRCPISYVPALAPPFQPSGRCWPRAEGEIEITA
jgi:hypothetical protein